MFKPTFTVRAISSVLILSILLSSCASSTMINSGPENAKIYIDGEPVGKTPYLHTDTKIIGSTTTVKLEKEGYQPFYTTFSRNEQADAGAIIGGLFVWIPFLWTMKYKPTRTYEMIPISADSSVKAEKLRELQTLLDEKLITKEEYEMKRAKIIEEDSK
ncbi:MAG: PEGA domain-containing protein [Bacteroidales bacterium]